MALTFNQKLFIGIGVLIVVLLVVNAAFLFGLNATNPVQATGQNPAVSLPQQQTEVIAIISPECEKCVDVQELAGQIQSLGINFSQRQLVFETDAEAKALVAQYGIRKLPGLVIKANPSDTAVLAGRWTVLGTVEDANVLVLRQVPPPYFDLASQTTRGLVNFWSIGKKECVQCTPAPTAQALQQLHVGVAQEKILDATDPAAQQLIAQYSITKLPVFLLSGDIREYSQLMPVLELGGTFESDGTWVLRSPLPYYWDLLENRLVGGVQLTRVTDKACSECFDVSALESFVVQNFGLKIAGDKNVDWQTPEGKKLVNDYNISRLPTIVLGGELFAYNGLRENWRGLGFAASDGNLVFASHDQLGSQYKYFDIQKNAVVAPPQQAQPSG